MRTARQANAQRGRMVASRRRTYGALYGALGKPINPVAKALPMVTGAGAHGRSFKAQRRAINAMPIRLED